MTPRFKVDHPNDVTETLERLAQEVSQLAFHVKETVTELRSENEGADNGGTPEHSRNGSGGGEISNDQSSTS